MNVHTDRDQLLGMTVYPGMDPAESRVLRQYIRRRGDGVAEWRFNVRIGEGRDAGADVDEATRRAWRELTKARTDVVAWRPPNAATVVEAKDVWTNEAVWQLLGYRDLYRTTFPGHTITLHGVARDASPTSITLARSQGIALYLYDLPPAGVDIREAAAERGPE